MRQQQRSQGERVTSRRLAGQRALERQLAYQDDKAVLLRGREEQVAAALRDAWGAVEAKVQRVAPLAADARILEVGSGAHGLVFGIRGRRAVGVDPLAVEYARLFPAWQADVPTLAGDGARLPFADGCFDLVLCDNVVDHAERPAGIVQELVRVLAPDGVLYFTVNVHHAGYAAVAMAHRAWNGAGLRLELRPFADHTVHLTPAAARRLFDGLPVDVRHEATVRLDPAAQAQGRRLAPLQHLVLRALFKNAVFELIARRRPVP